MKGATPKKASAYRLSPLALSIIDRLARSKRTTKTATVETALLDYFREAIGGRCYSCGDWLTPGSVQSVEVDHLVSFEVGEDCGCWEKVIKSGKRGYQPPTGGPRLYTRENLPS